MIGQIMKDIRAVAMDVDGVLTDGTFWWGANGEELKRFCFADSTGIAQAMKAGIRVALVSGESSESGEILVQRLADKLKIDDVYKGCHDKRAALEQFAAKHNLMYSQICFIGDDFIDAEAMSIAGLAACPSDAHATAKEKADLIAQKPGGHGAVREVLDLILANTVIS